MQKIGTFLVIAAFAFGAYLTALDPYTVLWTAFLPVVALGTVGVFLVKRADGAAARDSAALAASHGVLEAALGNIVKNLQALDGRKDQVPTYDMRFEIDALFRDDLFVFAEHRQAMKPLFGLEAYADVMSNFAAGERYINRVWSASTDGYVDEVMAYVSRAHAQFLEADAAFKRAAQKNTG